MKRHTVGVALLLGVFGLFVGVNDGQADIWFGLIDRDFLSDNSYGKLHRANIGIIADEPIEAIGGISLGDLVCSAGPQTAFLGYPPYLEDHPDLLEWWLESMVSTTDTHLLIAEHRFGEFTGSPIIETYEDGFGTFTQEPDGMMTLLPEYQTTSMDLIQIVSPDYGPNLSLRVRTASQTYHAFILPWPIEGTCGYYMDSPENDFGDVRVGTSATREIQNANAGMCFCYWWTSAPGAPGEGWVDLSFPEVDAPFGLDSANYFRSACYSFSPQIRGQADIAADCLDHGQPDPRRGHLTFTGRGVGPVFEAGQTPGTTLEFGNLQIDSFFDVFTEIGNLTDDPELGDLTSLTACASIEGDEAGAFHLIEGDLLELLVGQTDRIHLRFDAAGLAPGEYEAELVIQTDIGAAAGETGQGEIYSFPLHAIVVPEPSTLAGLLGLLAMSMLLVRHR